MKVERVKLMHKVHEYGRRIDLERKIKSRHRNPRSLNYHRVKDRWEFQP